VPKPISTIGPVEIVSFPTVDVAEVLARVDTGARTSSVWGSAAIQEDGRLKVVLFGAASPLYTGSPHYFTDFAEAVVVSSNGQSETRYKVDLVVVIGGKKIRAGFTLADRRTQVYPVLIGRNVLRGKFIVDVTQGQARLRAEKQHLQALPPPADAGNSKETHI
jgi:hypothetical protein